MARHSKVDSPAELASGSGATRTRFVQKRGYYAVHHWAEERGEHPFLIVDDAAIFRGDGSAHAERKEGPVYEVQPGGTPAVPTGRVFLRFAKHVDAEKREDEIRKAGYRVVEKIKWAPQAVWVEASSGEVADSLRNLNKLERIDDVENVEAQMIMPAATRV